MSAIPPLSGDEPKSGERAATAAFEPEAAAAAIVQFPVNRKIGLNNGIISSTHPEDAAQ
jgi:hypothetical protein